jgi:hypothetical protein
MVDRRVKIKDKWYEYMSCNAQVKMTFAGYDKHAMDYTIKFDIKYLNDFKSIFNKTLNSVSASEYKFDMRLGEIISHGTFIISIDFQSEEYFSVNLTCDSFRTMHKSEIRDEKLDIILVDEFID